LAAEDASASVDEGDFDFEFDFFPDQPEAIGEEGEELLWEEPASREAPRRAPARTSPASPSVVARRRVAAAAAVALLLIIILVVVLTSGSGGGISGTYRSYLTGVSSVATSSEQTGSALGTLNSKTAVAKLTSLIQQTSHDIGRLEALTPPAPLAQAQGQALASLDLRLRGLQGLRDSLSQALGGSGDTAWEAAVSTQVDDLVTSDVIWDQSVRLPADAVLQARSLGAAFPPSTFVADRTALLTSLGKLLGTSATSSTGPTLSLGSKGADVTAWQTALNRWLTANGQAALTVDGTFGPSTQTATEALQTAEGLSADGVVGPNTRSALQQALKGTSASSGTPSTSTQSLKLGDTGSAVVAWQTQLNQWLKATASTQTQLTTDGSFGQATQTATEQLQTAAGLTPTGVVDAATQQALQTQLAHANPNRG
jgi:peptidoglycan hydrolase-like protein with peptidoglycan-binding domain